MRGRNSTLKQKLEYTATKDIAVCSIVKAELFYGAMKSAKPQRNLTLQQQFLAQFTSLPFDDLAATTLGTIRSQHFQIVNEAVKKSRWCRSCYWWNSLSRVFTI